MIKASHRVAIYLRVSTLDQTTANQERELREVACRMGCEVVRVYRALNGVPTASDAAASTGLAASLDEAMAALQERW